MLLNMSQNWVFNPMKSVEIMASPQSIHVYPATLKTLPYRDESLDALFYVEAGQPLLERRAIFDEACRILRSGGMFFVAGNEWGSELEGAGFAPLKAGLPLAIPTSWRAAYLSIQNGRLHITELEKSHVFPLKSPFFETAVCVTKP